MSEIQQFTDEELIAQLIAEREAETPEQRAKRELRSRKTKLAARLWPAVSDTPIYEGLR